MTLEPPGVLAPKSLLAARVELHWAAQILAGVGSAWLEPRDDDSHTNLGWDTEFGAFVGHAARAGQAIGLRVADLTLLEVVESAVMSELALSGRTLAQGLAWADVRMGRGASESPRALHLPTYEMPEHRVQSGAPFELAPEQLAELGRWYATADAILRALAACEPHTTDVRCWPHHFDIAATGYLDSVRTTHTSPQIGFGMSPGDASYAEPYFYVTPHPMLEGVALPVLASGHWHAKGWVGAVLTATRALDTGAPAEAARGFLESAIRACRSLIALS